jgi:ribosome maturation factor RimP
MKPTDATTTRLWNIAEPVCAGAGYEFVDLVLTQSGSGWVLRVFIDYPLDHSTGTDKDASSDSRISFDDCERVSRELSAVLDVEDPITHPYSLEVSSPGLDRPLRAAAHFERFVGQVARVTLHQGINGRRNFKGTLVSVVPGLLDASGHDEHTFEQADVTITINVDGTEYRLPFNDIENARLVPDWDALFQRGQQ